MVKNEIASAIENFIAKIKEAVHGNEETASSESRQPRKRHRKERTAVDDFTARIGLALKGNNAAAGIKDAVWQLLRNIGVETPTR